jgi:hypothetical protein
MSPNQFPKVVLSALFVMFTGVFSAGFSQQDKKQTTSSQPKKQVVKDTRSDSQKSYIPPRTRDAGRNAGNPNTVKTSDRTNKSNHTVRTDAPAEKKLPLRK